MGSIEEYDPRDPLIRFPSGPSSDHAATTPEFPKMALAPKKTCIFWYHGSCNNKKCPNAHETHITWPIDVPKGYEHRRDGKACTLPLCPLNETMQNLAMDYPTAFGNPNSDSTEHETTMALGMDPSLPTAKTSGSRKGTWKENQTCFWWYHGQCRRGEKCDRAHKLFGGKTVVPPAQFDASKHRCQLPFCSLRGDAVVGEGRDDKYNRFDVLKVYDGGLEPGGQERRGKHTDEGFAIAPLVKSSVPPVPKFPFTGQGQSTAMSAPTLVLRGPSTGKAATPSTPRSLTTASSPAPSPFTIGHARMQNTSPDDDNKEDGEVCSEEGEIPSSSLPRTPRKRQPLPSQSTAFRSTIFSSPSEQHGLPPKPPNSLTTPDLGHLRNANIPNMPNLPPSLLKKQICFTYYHHGVCSGRKATRGRERAVCKQLHMIVPGMKQTVAWPPKLEAERHDGGCALPLCPLKKRHEREKKRETEKEEEEEKEEVDLQGTLKMDGGWLTNFGLLDELLRDHTDTDTVPAKADEQAGGGGSTSSAQAALAPMLLPQDTGLRPDSRKRKRPLSRAGIGGQTPTARGQGKSEQEEWFLSGSPETKDENRTAKKRKTVPLGSRSKALSDEERMEWDTDLVREVFGEME
jgi:hypothetical protein